MMYAILEGGVVTNTAVSQAPLVEWDGVTIPVTGWIELPEGVEIGDLFDGEAFTKPEPVVVVPLSVTPRQAKLALLGAGLLDSVDAALDAIVDPTEQRAAQIEWEYAIEFRRDAPLIAAIGGALGLTDEQIDTLFVAAAAI